jgi:hypothetical protein
MTRFAFGEKCVAAASDFPASKVDNAMPPNPAPAV